MTDEELTTYRLDIDAIISEWAKVQGSTSMDQVKDYRARVRDTKVRADYLKKYCKAMMRHWQTKLDDCDYLKKQVEAIEGSLQDQYYSLRDDAKSFPSPR